MTPDKERNIAHARKAIEEAASKGAQLVMLPVSFYSLSSIYLFIFNCVSELVLSTKICFQKMGFSRLEVSVEVLLCI